MALGPELRRALFALPPEQQELADELYESLVDRALDPEWERAWSSEIEQRMKDVVDSRVMLIDVDDVHRELRVELRDRTRR